MTIAYTNGIANGALSGTSATTTVHSIAINSGDLVVAYVNSNIATAITADSGGTLFTRELTEQPGALTSQHALFWKIAGVGEPTAYTFTVGDAQWQVILKVFSSTVDMIVDAAITSHLQGGNELFIAVGAIDTEVIADNALSIVAGGKDNRSGTPEDYTTTDPTDYISALGSSGDQAAAMAHKIWTPTGTTFSGSVNIKPTDLDDSRNDVTYSMHISFVEGAGGTNETIFVPTGPIR